MSDESGEKAKSKKAEWKPNPNIAMSFTKADKVKWKPNDRIKMTFKEGYQEKRQRSE